VQWQYGLAVAAPCIGGLIGTHEDAVPVGHIADGS
jgi:hypothetical protein